jgi:hypothetical protein
MNGRRVVPVLLFACLAISMITTLAEGTVFAREGFGWWWDQGDPAALGRGGTSVAETGYGATGEVNPATIAMTDLSYGYGAWSGEAFKVKGSLGTFKQRADLLPHVGGVIVLPVGLRAMALLRTQTDAGYDRVQRFDTSPSGAFTLTTKGEGGWNRLEVGLSGPALNRRILWGGAVSRIMGSVTESWTYQFDDASANRVRETSESRLGGGWMGTGGIVFRPDPRLEVGASGTFAGSSRLVQEVLTVEGGNNDVSTSSTPDLPTQWGIGAHVRPIPRLSFSADMVETRWKAPFDNAMRWGAGVEYAAEVSPEAPAPRLPRWVLRAGYAKNPFYVRATNGSRVEERAATFGLGLRGGHGRAAIDIALAAGKRGDVARTGVEESFYRLSVGLSFSSVVREY